MPGVLTISNRVPDGAQRINALSDRQQELLKLLASDQSVNDIACRLNITWNTLRVHLGRIYRALGVKNRSEAVATILPLNARTVGTVRSLCAREREVLTLLADDLSMIDVASRLNITINTVRKHLSQIYQSLRVKNRSEAVARFRAENSAPGGASPTTISPPSLPTNSTSLSQREREVLNLLAENRSRDDIARSLSITKGTLRGHTSRIYDKLGVKCWQDAVASIQPKDTVPTTVLASLTEREMGVLRLVSSDLSAKETAVILGISQGTVYVYLSNIYRTIGVKTRPEAIALFRREAAGGTCDCATR